MSNRRTHRVIGNPAGGGYALAKAQQQPPEHGVVEAVGGTLAGSGGARLPEVLDQPLHPGHRGFAHGVIPVVVPGRAAVGGPDAWPARYRAEAVPRAALRASAAASLEAAWRPLVELPCHVGAAALAGLLAGYGSHVALAGFTPPSLPLLR
jgi:hypothetical protein